MVSLTCDADRRDGVTLVTARLEGSGVAQRVRLANRLDGPAWPPRRQGIAEDGWEGNGFETVVAADGTVAVGYASPAPPTDPPVAVVDREIVDGDAIDESGRDGSATAADALWDLGDPSPPRDAVPLPGGEASTSSGQSDDTPPEPDERTVPRQSVRACRSELTASAIGTTDESRADTSDGAAPATVASWLDDVERRVAIAERLAAAETLPEATAALREAGGLDEAERLVETLRRDADGLAAVVGRAERLADRTAAADVPLETFERLA